MKTRRQPALLLAFVLTLALSTLALSFGLLTGCEDKSGPVENITGSLASFTAQTLDGGEFTQKDIEAKDVTIINFWGTFCRPCIAEMPYLAAYAKSLPDNVQLITVCMDGAEEPEEAKRILDEAGFTGVTLVTGDGDFTALCEAIDFAPTTILVDSKGQVTGKTLVGADLNENMEMHEALQDFAEEYTQAVNEVLKKDGKEEISVAVS